MRRTSLILLAVLVGVLFFMALLLYAFQDRLLYFPLRTIGATPESVGLSYDDVDFVSSDGVPLTGWFVPVEHPRATVLFCHGNGGNISLLIESVRMFHSLQLNVLVFDYRGYGRSEGSPDEEGTYADAEAAWHYLTDTMGVPPAKILVVGRSLGGAIAAWLTARNTPAALVIESSFTSLPDLASELYPWLPVRILTRYAYDTEGSLASVHCPVLVIHSRDDEVIPFTHGEELFGAVQTQKTFLEIRGRHNEGFLLSSKAYLGAIDTLLRSALKTEPATRDERSAGSHSRQIP